jgi:hypothetical protein
VPNHSPAPASASKFLLSTCNDPFRPQTPPAHPLRKTRHSTKKHTRRAVPAPKPPCARLSRHFVLGIRLLVIPLPWPLCHTLSASFPISFPALPLPYPLPLCILRPTKDDQ